MNSQSIYLGKLISNYGSHATETDATNLHVLIYAIAPVKIVLERG
jgi:hypothetical protein